MSIVTMRAKLTDSDIRTLIKGPTEEDRAHAAHKICRCIDEAELSPEERAHAEGIIAIMAQDAAVLVRRALVGGAEEFAEAAARDRQQAGARHRDDRRCR